ncbi:MAG TPA: hypothetical protein VFT59_00560 [Candidatus Saccharimonadales bacterium]|nr:hypothetical protein [Candidatus Saccharimonadales bacterium]
MDSCLDLSRCYGSTFLRSARAFGYDEQRTKELWCKIVSTVRTARYCTDHASVEFITLEQLQAMIRAGQPRDITDDDWRLTEAIASRLVSSRV